MLTKADLQEMVEIVLITATVAFGAMMGVGVAAGLLYAAWSLIT